ncbi:MAG: immunoglobulin domain-containing protein, partial [Chitinophagaceae bacterium]|nr:immunoglobulin domain-containing protein [Chitinophagaceae bacterium]
MKYTFNIHVFGILLTVLIGHQLMAQTTINTNYVNSPPVNVLNTQPSYVTFTVNNSNNYAVAITAIGTQHIASAVIAGTPAINYSQNNCEYILWYNENSTGATPITTANGWMYGSKSGVINVNTNGVIPVMTNIEDVVISPNSTYKFALACTDSISAVGNTTTPALPGSFTSNGVTLTTTGQTWGQFPTNSQNNNQSFNGNIVFQRAIPKPEIKAAPIKAQYCFGDKVILTANTESYVSNPVFTWKYNGNVVGTGSTYTINALDNTNAGLYTCTVSDGTVTSFEGTYNITVLDPPAPTIDGKVNYCLNEAFVPVTINGQNPKWYYTTTGGSPIPVTPTINTATPNSAIYYVTQTVNGCESSKRTVVKLTAAPQPEAPVVNTPIYYCENTPSDQLRAVGNMLNWYYEPTGGLPTSIAPTPNTSKMDEFDYYVTQTVDGCESERSQIEVIVTFKPNGLILVDKNEICAEDTVEINYYGSAYPNAAYNWVLPDGTNYNTGIDQGPLVLQLDKPGTQQITLQVGNKGCLSDLYSTTILVKPLPEGTVAIQSDICQGQDYLVSMPSYTKTIDNFTWDFDGGTASHYATGQGSYGVTWNTPGKKTLQVTLVDNGCEATVYTQTTVHEKPDARIVIEDYVEGDVICASEKVKIYANTAEIASSYEWSPEILFNGDNYIPVTYAKIDANSAISLKVTDEFGCIGEETIKILAKPCCEMTFPNAFSPNNDSRNDIFRPIVQGDKE